MIDPLVANERTKLLANVLNTACLSCLKVGIASPAAGFIDNVSGFRKFDRRGDLVFSFRGWISTAIGLHLVRAGHWEDYARE